MRSPVILRLLLLSTVALAQTVVSNFYWQDYTNDCEASCLTAVFNQQQCSLANACSSNHCMTLDYSCLCGTASWLNTTSKCIGASCGAGAVHEAASIASNECKTAGVAMAISENKIIQVGLAAAPPTPTSSSPTASPSSGQNNSSSGGGLSTKLQVIIGVITSIAGLIVAVVGVLFAWKQYKQTKAHTRHTKSHSNPEAALSTTALAAVAVAPARGSVSEERQSEEGTARPLPSSQAVAAALRRVDS